MYIMLIRVDNCIYLCYWNNKTYIVYVCKIVCIYFPYTWDRVL